MRVADRLALSTIIKTLTIIFLRIKVLCTIVAAALKRRVNYEVGLICQKYTKLKPKNHLERGTFVDVACVVKTFVFLSLEKRNVYS